MKKIAASLLFLTLALALGGCRGGGTQHKPTSMGALYEIVVVTAQQKWDGPLGDTLRAIASERVEHLHQSEPLFKINRVPPNNFRNLMARHRNVLIVNTGPEYVEPSMTVVYDHYAAPQIIVTLSGPDQATVTSYVSEHRQALQRIFNMAERDRYIAQITARHNEELAGKIGTRFGFDMKVDKSYTLRNELEDFLWMSIETQTSSQGIIIYSYPYEGREDFSLDSLVDKRDRFVSLVPAENPGSHMITYRGMMPTVSFQRINGRLWAEMRGNWDTRGDFMGGPFVSFTTLDTRNRRMVTIDGYLFSPDPITGKRNILRNLENTIFTVSFPGEAAPAAPATEQDQH